MVKRDDLSQAFLHRIINAIPQAHKQIACQRKTKARRKTGADYVDTFPLPVFPRHTRLFDHSLQKRLKGGEDSDKIFVGVFGGEFVIVCMVELGPDLELHV